jgi:hypothetical protein
MEYTELLTLFQVKNHLPENHKEYGNHTELDKVNLLEHRLKDLQNSLLRSSYTVATFEPDLNKPQRLHRSETLIGLASFSGLLAEAAHKMSAEVSETQTTFGRKAHLDPLLRKQLKSGMAKQLLDEIGGNFDDGDKADFYKQIKAFTTALNQQFNLSPKRER